VGVLFYLRSDGQYILVGEAVMAVFLFIIMLCDVLMYNNQEYNTAMTVLPAKIYCSSDLK
jgi:hypothetical protein